MNSSRVQWFTAKSDQELQAVIFSASFTPEEKELCQNLLASRTEAKRDAREEATFSIAKDFRQPAQKPESFARGLIIVIVGGLIVAGLAKWFGWV